ncbi:forespore regulator of the sigma-K checkpoint [[Bacillus] enclensis]|jgi:forespore regulator of the sigma-K checkpoint|uniref:Forespore regulator of the sigma-K checkpoint n=2 Tax=Rossellomorea TaxID=2837508 RepID=A0A1C4A7L8_9BACI|nr:intercompartmental signaling factor BofC [[Bacillus] enclensis]MBH9967119.1 intercompartmental signaling factor BofC [[Bacillus] enclensis]QTC43648.1 intercompartmental signaling factor BofC [Bacillus sp. V3]QWC21823.1 BofC C-terminal domain-containing protein [Bacillus haikouensis]SCB90566.1 forespore regulator of the sigma-K checkpoint [[Bacillus] enclensis]
MTMKIRIVFMVMLLLGAFYFTFFYTEEKQAADRGEIQQIKDQADVASAHTVTVKLERVYLDGEISEEIVQETIWSMEDFWAAYADWQLIDMTEEEVIFQKQVDDISPLLKTNGYFGISENGVLSIFNGKPGQAEIIQSFFQIDVEKLESNSHETLIKGIPVKSKQKFEEVLESFKQYSVPE